MSSSSGVSWGGGLLPLHPAGVGDEPLGDRVGGLDAAVQVDGEALAGGKVLNSRL